MNEVLGGGQGPQPRKMWLGRRPNHKPNPNQAEKNEGPSKARLASIERMMAATEELEERSKDSPRLAGFPRKPVMRRTTPSKLVGHCGSFLNKLLSPKLSFNVSVTVTTGFPR